MDKVNATQKNSTEKTGSLIASAKRVLQIESDAVAGLIERIDDRFAKVVQTLGVGGKTFGRGQVLPDAEISPEYIGRPIYQVEGFFFAHGFGKVKIFFEGRGKHPFFTKDDYRGG